MKYIVKSAEPVNFSDWKTMANSEWQPIYDDLSGAEKAAVKNALMEEQGYICCYCERRLTDNDSHIEHFRPQSDNAVDPLDYGNMLCSCQKHLNKGDPRHCGNLKNGWFDEQLLISPLTPACEVSFAYTADGEIYPADKSDKAAVATIKRLGLGISKVNAMRSMAIEPFLSEDLDAEDLNNFVIGYLKRDNQGMFGEFWTTVNFLFGDYTTI